MEMSFTEDCENVRPEAAAAAASPIARIPFSDNIGFFGFGLEDCGHDDSFMRFVNSPTGGITLPGPLTFDEDDEDNVTAADTSAMNWELGASAAFRPSPSEPARTLPAGQRLASELPRKPSAPPPQPSRSRLSCKRPSPTVIGNTDKMTVLLTSTDNAGDYTTDDDDMDSRRENVARSGAIKSGGGTPKRRRLGRPLGDLTNSTTPTFKKPQLAAFAAPVVALHRCSSELACSRADADGGSKPTLHRQESVATALDSSRVDRAIASIDSLNLIGNSEQRHALPTVKELDYGIRHVTSATVSRLVNGDFASSVSSYAIIDCRYPYEFSGGHIQGAVNVFTQEDLLLRFLEPASSTTGSRPASVLIFHCEFSSERAPKLARFLRQRDREANASNYPDLFYPEVYVLQGGYKAFYEHFKSNCHPASYVKMVDPDFKAELAHFQRVGRAWERQHSRSKHSRLERLASGAVLF